MNVAVRRLAATLVGAVLAVPLPAAPPVEADDAAIVHALNRLGYGPRPGDVERVARIGLDRWIAQQLQPRGTDAALDTRLGRLRTAGLSSHELLDGYAVPREARREIQKKRAELGEDPEPGDLREIRREIAAKYGQDMAGAPRLVLEELQAAKLLRATYAEHQLEEVLVDFWMNHFNVFAGKRPLQYLVGEYEREVIRPHVWGSFHGLLKATAESPAMLYYLDNWLSVDPKAAERMMEARSRRPLSRRGMGARPTATGQQRPPAGRRRGLNENYAREVMELHTLGVEGGYTQQDVTEVARCFTGWTIAGLRDEKPRFAFDSRVHDDGTKTVLGARIAARGKAEGDEVLRRLATHPATARFIATKLARRFVADEPPASVVDRAAETFRRTNGNLREVVGSILRSPEFLAPATRSVKVKTPFEFVASALRATAADVTETRDLSRRLTEMGMPLYGSQPPTGYKDTADAWVSTSGLLARLNFALDLAGGRVRGVTVPPLPGGAAALEAALLPVGLSDASRRTLAAEKDLTPARTAGLLLGSPEFQRR